VAERNGFRGWVDLFFKHFWKIFLVAVVVLWLMGKFPIDPKDVLEFAKEAMRSSP
jgi:hypothetical protein